MPLTLKAVIRFLGGVHVKPEDHDVFVDSERVGTCTRASFRSVYSLRGVEFPVAYAYSIEGVETLLTSRLRSQGLGRGGREQIKVNGQDVESDDVLVGFEIGELGPVAYVEFRYVSGGQPHSVKFVAPIDQATD